MVVFMMFCLIHLIKNVEIWSTLSTKLPRFWSTYCLGENNVICRYFWPKIDCMRLICAFWCSNRTTSATRVGWAHWGTIFGILPSFLFTFSFSHTNTETSKEWAISAVFLLLQLWNIFELVNLSRLFSHLEHSLTVHHQFRHVRSNVTCFIWTISVEQFESEKGNKIFGTFYFRTWNWEKLHQLFLLFSI